MNNIDIIKKILVEITINKWKNKIILEKIEEIKKSVDEKDKVYKDLVLEFIEEIKDDIKSNREINIDSTNNDEYTTNYFETKIQIQKYNSIIKETEYREIIKIINSKNIDIKNINKNLEKIEKNYISKIKGLDTKIISKNLLIYTTFERKNHLQALNRLGLIFEKIGFYEWLKRINNLIKLNNKIIEKIKIEAIKNLKNNSFNYKYISFKKDVIWYTLSDNITDTSKYMYRSWNPSFEYRNIIKKIKS